MSVNYKYPSERIKHEGTWLIWPHRYTYGDQYRKEIEPIWIEMVKALHLGEKVHIVAYSDKEQERITSLLTQHKVHMKQINFVIVKSDDVWVRDTGPIFVYDQTGNLMIVDFAFNGWGKKVAYRKDDAIPQAVAKAINIPMKTIPELVLEGGAIEMDGYGTLMACKSSVLSGNRNPKLLIEQVEEFAEKYLGVEHFIWLDGVINEDITDAHIDGIARFYDHETILTVSEDDFFELYENIRVKDYQTLISARNKEGHPYKIVTLPMTAENVKGLDYKGSYLNFYIANDVVLVPIYQDLNDEKAIQLLSSLYVDKRIIPIDVTELYRYGGMLHCITQQQPIV